MHSEKKGAKRQKLAAAGIVCEDTLGLHSVSDEARRLIFNSTCRALDQNDKQIDQSSWKDLSRDVLPEIFYPVELAGVDDDKPVVFYMCNVKKCLETVFAKCSNYACLVQQVMQDTPGIVFDLLLYNDEASGGNILAPNSAKKVSLWYFSLRQAGFLWADCVWHPLCLLQHPQFDKIKGGFSAATCKIVQELSDQQLNLGFPVQFANGFKIIRLQLSHMLSDLDSIRYALDCKGSAGIRCCHLCSNCVKKDSKIPDYNNYFKDISHHKFNEFVEQTDGDIFDVIDQLSDTALRVSKSALQKKETACGFNHNPDGLLSHRLCRDMLPPSSFILDSMHLYWSQGIAALETNTIYRAWKELGVGDLHAFLAMDWKTGLQPTCSPSWRKTLGHDSMFVGNAYKGSAANLVAFLPLFEYFLSRVLSSRSLLENEMASFKALGRISIELRKLQHQQGQISTEKLQELQISHQKMVVQAYGAGYCKPKHHMRFHQAVQMKRNNFHCDAFAAERKHKTYKSHIGLHRFDTWSQNDRGAFSQLVLRAIWQHHVPSLQSFVFGTELLGTTSMSEQISAALGKNCCRTSCKIQHRGKTLQENDLLLGAHPGIIKSLAQADSDFYVVIQPLQLEEQTEFWSRWNAHGNKKLLPISQIGRTPTWWLNLQPGSWLCLH